jgi:hypothetical protein
MFNFDQWDWARLGLAVAIVVCNFFVWRGVSLEESDDRYDKETGKRWLVNALAWEFFFAMVLVVADTVGGVHQKAQIASLNAQIAPRRLQPDQQAAIAKGLETFAGKSVLIGSYLLDVEAAILGGQITEAIKAARISTNSEWLMSVQGGAPIALGVHVTGNDAPLVSALLKALGKYHEVSPIEPFPNGFTSTNFARPIGIPPEAIVFVGIKPIE